MAVERSGLTTHPRDSEESHTESHDFPSTQDMLAFFGAHWGDTINVDFVQYASENGTQEAQISATDNDTETYGYSWLPPSNSGTNTIELNQNASAAGVFGCFNLKNAREVKQTATANDTGGFSITLSDTEDGSLCHCAIARQGSNGAYNETTGATAIYEVGGHDVFGIFEHEGGGDVTFTFTITFARSTSCVAWEVAPALAGGNQGITWFMFENARRKYDEIFKPRGYNEPILVPEAA